MFRQPGTAKLNKLKSQSSAIKKENNFNTNTTETIERIRNQSYVTNQSKDDRSKQDSEFLGRIDDYEGLFTNQQLESIDFSNFRNHVFFDSAVSKVHYSYDRILNDFPYDKSQYYFNQYFNSLDGFTKYVYDNFIPKNKGYLNFDGTNTVIVNDVTDNILNQNKEEKKVGLINLNKRKFSFDFWLYVDNVDNNEQLGKQIVFQKLYSNSSINNGITIYLDNFRRDESLEKNFCKINALITHSQSYHLCSAEICLGEFNHINFSFFNAKGKKHSKFYYNGIREKSSSSGSLSKNKEFSNLFLNTNFFIGNGFDHICERDSSLNVIKTTGLIGYIDEFRFFTGSRSDQDISKEKNINLHAKSGLEIYYKFNEPSSSYLNNHVVLDYSGHKTCGIIKKIDLSTYTQIEIKNFREKQTNIDFPLVYEKKEDNPVLFARFENILSDQEILLKKARKYDDVNPNIFYKFFPKSLFLESANAGGISGVFVSGEFIDVVEGNKINRTDLLKVEKPDNSLLVKLITIWARFFDQFKCYIDHITNIIDINYEDLNKGKKHSSIILPYAVSKLGFSFEEIFPSPILEKLDNKNLEYNELISETSIRQIQNNLWKRFLINSQDYITSKGTINSVKSVFNSFGLDVDTFINIREFNSQNKLNIYPGFKEKLTALKYIDFFENDIMLNSTQFNNNGLPINRVYFETTKQSSDFINLSADWSIETFIKFDHLKLNNYNNKQSIFRLDISPGNSTIPYINVIFEREKNTSQKGTLKLFVNEVNLNNEIKVAEINDVSILSGKIYYVCLTKKNKSSDCSEYVLSVINSDKMSRIQKTNNATCKVKIINKSVNLSNPSLRIGSLNVYEANDLSTLTNLDFHSTFEGKLIGLKVWSKTLNPMEKNIHKTDIFCHGSNDFNIVSSLNNLKVNINFRENIKNNIDNRQNTFLSLYNDVKNSDVSNLLFIPDTYIGKNFINIIDYVALEQSSAIDYPENYNRVNINSLEDVSLSKDFNNYLVNPSYETDSDFSSFDDIRLSIDFSSSKFINKEISKMILVNNYFTQNLSNRSNLYASEYQSLYELRNVFYEKLEKEINIKQLYQVYKYFDNILEKLLYDAVPSKVHYQGFNFVYESSIAERHKYQYKMSDSRFPVIDSSIDYSRYNTRYASDEFWNSSDIRLSTFSRTDNNQIISTTPFK